MHRFHPIRAAALLASLGVPTASAWAAPELTVSDQTVVASVVVAAPVEAVLAVVRDPTEIARLSASKTEVKTQPAGGCLLVDYAASSVIGDVAYRARQCDTVDGALARLEEPLQDMAEYEARWVVSASAEGTRIDYRLRAVPNFPVPASLAARAMRGPVRKLLSGLEEHFGTK